MFKIGQLRRSQIGTYDTSLPYKQTLIRNENSIITFYDQSMLLSGGGVVSSLYSYYLKFEVKQLTSSAQDFVLKLQSDDISNISGFQELREFKVKQGDQKVVFEIIFNPNSTYNHIVFELKRLSVDFYTNNSDGTSGRIMDIKILKYSRIINVISDYLSKNYTGLKTLKKISVQGPLGLLFCIDGEEIQIGNSGIYELYNENKSISYVGFIINDSLTSRDGLDYFIMDFKY